MSRHRAIRDGLQGAADLTWTRPVRQDLHAGDARQLHLKVALAVQEQIPGGQSSTQTAFGPVFTTAAWPRSLR